MAVTYYLSSTTSDLTGGADFNLELSEGTPPGSNPLAVTVAAGATEISHGFTASGVPGAAGAGTGDYTVEVNVTSANSNIQLSVQLVRVNSAGTAQSNTAVSAEQSLGSTGVKTFNFTSQTLGFTAGDRLRVDYRFRSTAAHGNNSVSIDRDSTNAEVVTPFTAAPVTGQAAASLGGTFTAAGVEKSFVTGQAAASLGGTFTAAGQVVVNEVTFRSSSFVANAQANSITLDVPTGTVEGDVMLAWIRIEADDTPAATGWTAIEHAFLSSSGGTLLYRVATDSEPTSYTFTWSTSTWRNGSITSWQGQQGNSPGVNPFGDAGATTIQAGTGTTIASQSVTAVADGRAVWMFGQIQADGNTITPPSGYDVHLSNSSGCHRVASHPTTALEGTVNSGTGTCQASSPAWTVCFGVLPHVLSAPAVTGQGSASLGGTFTASGVPTTHGQAAASLGGTFTASGVVSGAEVGQASASLGGTFTASGTVTTPSSAVEFVGVVTAADPEVTGDGDVSLAPHANTAPGDLLLAWVTLDSASSTTIDTPTGWTSLGNPIDAATSSRSALFWKLAGASEGATNFTSSSDHINVTLATYTNVDQTTPINASATGSTASGTSRAVPSVTSTVDDVMLVSFIQIDLTSGTGGEFTPPTGWTERADWIESTTFQADACADFLAGAAGSQTGHSWTSLDSTRPSAQAVVAIAPGVSPAVEGQADAQLGGTFTAAGTVNGTRTGQAVATLGGTFTASGSSATPQSVTTLWVGGVTTTGATVTATVSGGTNAQLVASTSSDLSNPITGDSAAISSNRVKVSVTGLSAGTQYFYGLKIDGLPATGLEGEFRTAPSGAASFEFAFGSCHTTGGNSSAFTRALARDPDLCFINGDLHYEDPGSSAEFHTGYDTQLDGTFGDMTADVPTGYTWSDHDWSSDNNGGASSAMNATANSIFRERVPHWTLASGTSTGIQQTFTWGRVRFIITDERSFKSDNSATDNSSKTMLGSAQKTWFKDLITNSTEPLIFWIGDTPWNGAASSPDDEWFAYNTERQELATHIVNAGKADRVIRCSGDMHALAADDGSNSPGGIRILHGAPWRQAFSNKAGPYTEGPYPTSGADIQQYAYVTVTDDGTSLTVDYAGYDSSDVRQLSYTFTLGTAAASLGGTFTASGVSSAPTVTGQADAQLGGTFTASGVDRALGQASTSLGGTFTASGVPNVVGQGTTTLGGTFTASGVDRALGQAAASLGGTASVTGVITVLGQASTSLGGTFTAAGTVTGVATGQASTDLGGTFTASGVDRALGQASTSLGGAFTASGVDRALGQAAAQLGGTATAAGTVGVTGQAAASLGGTFDAAGTVQGVTTGQASSDLGGTFTASGLVSVTGQASASLEGTFTATGSVTGVTTGQADAQLGGTFTATGVDRALGTGSSSLGGTFDASGVDRALGTASTSLGGTFTADGVDRALGAASATLGPTSTASGVRTTAGQASTELGGTFTATGEVVGVKTGQASASFGGTFDASGVRGRTGVASGELGGTFDASGVDRALGQASASLGGTSTAAGIVTKVGQGSTSLGGTFEASGTNTPVTTGQASASLGGTGSATGRRTVSGQAGAVLVATLDAAGRRLTFAAGSTSLGGTFDAAGVDRALGQLTTDLGGTFDGSGVGGPPSSPAPNPSISIGTNESRISTSRNRAGAAVSTNSAKVVVQ